MNSKLILAAVVLLWIFALVRVWADEEDDVRMGRPTFGENGHLFTVTFTPGDRSIDVQFTGNTVATIDPNQIKLFGTSYSFDGRPQDLNLRWTGKNYKIMDELDQIEDIDIQIKDKRTNKSETFHLHAQPKVQFAD